MGLLDFMKTKKGDEGNNPQGNNQNPNNQTQPQGNFRPVNYTNRQIQPYSQTPPGFYPTSNQNNNPPMYGAGGYNPKPTNSPFGNSQNNNFNPSYEVPSMNQSSTPSQFNPYGDDLLQSSQYVPSRQSYDIAGNSSNFSQNQNQVNNNPVNNGMPQMDSLQNLTPTPQQNTMGVNSMPVNSNDVTKDDDSQLFNNINNNLEPLNQAKTNNTPQSQSVEEIDSSVQKNNDNKINEDSLNSNTLNTNADLNQIQDLNKTEQNVETSQSINIENEEPLQSIENTNVNDSTSDSLLNYSTGVNPSNENDTETSGENPKENSSSSSDSNNTESSQLEVGQNTSSNDSTTQSEIVENNNTEDNLNDESLVNNEVNQVTGTLENNSEEKQEVKVNNEQDSIDEEGQLDETITPHTQEDLEISNSVQNLESQEKSMDDRKEETEDMEKDKIEIKPETYLANNIFQRVGLLGLNAVNFDPTKGNEVKTLSKKLNSLGKNLSLDTNKGLGEFILQGAKEVEAKTKVIHLKPYLSTVSTTSSAQAEMNNSTSIVFSNFLERIKYILNENDLFIFFSIEGINNLSLFLTLWNVACMYEGQHKPIIILDENIESMIESLKTTYGFKDDQTKVLKIVKTIDEALNAIEELEKEYSSKDKIILPNVIDRREEGDEKEFIVS